LSFTESESSFEDLLASEGGSGLVIRVESETFESLEETNAKVIESIKDLDGLKDIKSTFARDFPQMQVSLNRKNIARYGFNIQEVGAFLAGGMRGDVATEFKEFDKKIDVRVRFSEKDREAFDKILATSLTSTEGTRVPLADLVNIEMIKGLREILRFNQKRVALISANLDGVKISEMVPIIEAQLRDIDYPKGTTRPVISGEQEGIRNSFSQLGFALILSIILVYMIMAGQFESLKHPFIVILTVPMGVVGTVFMLYTFDLTINIMSIIGLIVLSGIVVNDAIVKIDFINHALEDGKMTLREAVLKASEVRLRPILMTTATTVLGLLPMATGMVTWLVNLPIFHGMVGWMDAQLVGMNLITVSELFNGQGAEIQKPLALVVIGGLTFATMMTLILIPVFYEIFAPKDIKLRVALPEGTADDKNAESMAEGTESSPEDSSSEGAEIVDGESDAKTISKDPEEAERS